MEKVTPEFVRAYMQKNGTEVTLEQAVRILDFLTLLAQATVSRYLKKDFLVVASAIGGTCFENQ